MGRKESNQTKTIVFFCLKIFFTFTNSVDPDEMQHNAAFHLGLHYLQKSGLRISRIQLYTVCKLK